MKSSDVVIGWVKDGQVYFADRHADGHFLPAKDSSQDWTMLMGQETGQYTVFKMVRQLDTCDNQDVAIKPGTTRVIWAYGYTDPLSEDAVSYHRMTRGTKSILLLDPPTSEQHGDALPSDVKVLEFTNRNLSVPADDTTYHCTMWRLPDLGGKTHMIRYEPIIQPGHQGLIHHMVLYYCANPTTEDDFPTDSFRCYKNPPQHLYSCYNVLVAWAIGGRVFNFPNHVGYPIGGPGDPGFFMLETHYDNPRMRSAFIFVHKPLTSLCSLPRIIYKLPDQYTGYDVFEITNNLDWTDPKVHQDFQQTIADSEYAQTCGGIGKMFQV
ncbi:DBH-like monooxygenase protein 1 [Elysia marginata]|uniref:DBH-like monooxygenase protein 1 n=1 Tax=Elysia marginata TaxID=1093978 RepID=A0AAV4ENX2_9GAST|nr:DBH-like monooxygenase protein 1 [Elysia marginata]